MTPIHFDQVNLVVRDVEASRAFYATLGIDFGDEHDPVWSRHHVSAVRPPSAEGPGADLDLDSMTFAAQWNRGWQGGPGLVIGFKVDSRQDVDDLVVRLTDDGVEIQQPPYDAFWGARYAVVSDPDGNAVGIMSPVDASLRSDPPSPGHAA